MCGPALATLKVALLWKNARGVHRALVLIAAAYCWPIPVSHYRVHRREAPRMYKHLGARKKNVPWEKPTRDSRAGGLRAARAGRPNCDRALFFNRVLDEFHVSFACHQLARM